MLPESADECGGSVAPPPHAIRSQGSDVTHMTVACPASVRVASRTNASVDAIECPFEIWQRWRGGLWRARQHDADRCGFVSAVYSLHLACAVETRLVVPTAATALVGIRAKRRPLPIVYDSTATSQGPS